LTNLDLAKRYLDLFFNSEFQGLRELFVDDLVFTGPLLQTSNADDYISAIKAEPSEMGYELMRRYEDEDSVCCLYDVVKPALRFPIVQVFKFRNGKISHIQTIFDASKLQSDM
jgi:ketosteroid isomerase-like protein